jgi:hypothetical protein
MHLASFPRAIAFADSNDRRIWFSRIKRWFEINGLAGVSSRRWIWDPEMRRKFDHTYSIISRRLDASPLSPPANAEQLSEEDVRAIQEIRILMEEIPFCQEFLFYQKHYFLMIMNGMVEALVLLWVNHYIIFAN